MQLSKRQISAENTLTAGLLVLCAGVFLGNAFIAAGQALVVLGMILALFRSTAPQWNWKRLRPSSWFLVAVTIFSLVSILANLETIADPLDFVKKLRYHAIAVALLSLACIRGGNLFTGQKRNFYSVAWLSALVLAVLAGLVDVLDLFGPDEEASSSGPERLSGFYGQVMTFANILQFSAVGLLVFAVRPAVFRKLAKIPWLVVVVVFVFATIGLYLSFTRGAVLGALVGIASAALYRSKWALPIFAGVAIIAGVFSYQQHTRYFEFGPVHRFAHWQGAALTFARYPVFGVGYRNYEARSAELKKEFGLPKDKKFKKQKNAEGGYLRRHAHNNYLEAFASTGVLGGLAFLGFCLCWTREAWRSRYAFLFVPLIAGFLVSGMFENTFFDSEVLNCVLLIYFFSQIAFDHENSSQDSEGVITTET